MRLKRFVEVVLIWENEIFLEIHCPYCNPCDPFETIIKEITLINFKNSVSQGIKNVDETYPNEVDIVLFLEMIDYKFLFEPEQRKMIHLLKHMSTISAFQFESFDLPEIPIPYRYSSNRTTLFG